jgi:hypothetical protein
LGLGVFICLLEFELSIVALTSGKAFKVSLSPSNGRIAVICTSNGDGIDLCIDDEGPGTPEFARPRVFEKFFSLERPGTGKKSTGLGLTSRREWRCCTEAAWTSITCPNAGCGPG